MPPSGPYDREAEVPANRARSRPSREPAWDWDFETDGSLALAPRPRPEPADAAEAPAGSALKRSPTSVSVPPMSWPQAPGLATRAALREQERARARRARRITALLVVAVVSLVTLGLTAFGTGGAELTVTTGPAPAERLLPSGPPRPQVIAMHDTLRLQLPADQDRGTAIAFPGAGAAALALAGLGTQANAGLLGRVRQRLFGENASAVRYYVLDDGPGPQTGGLDVGAPVDTDVYAPVDGTVIAIVERVVDRKPYGVRIDIQPSGNPGYVVAVSNVARDPALTVGSTVVAARTKIGRVIDLSAVERAALARYTQDKGQHVHLEVHTAASLVTP